MKRLIFCAALACILTTGAKAQTVAPFRDGDRVVVDVAPGGSGLWVGAEGAERPAQWSFDADVVDDVDEVIDAEPLDEP